MTNFIAGFCFGLLASLFVLFLVWQNNKKLFAEVTAIVKEALEKAEGLTKAEYEVLLEKLKSALKIK